ncbi:hypothetical protein [Mycolicibacterium phocaicum]|uniref:hypothetical protein n=1 Tax=Mycolicibacterium phocaicum TaxID=319706 RepID=UPI00138C26B8|nr:hypothetical protein [Mycolicibacterium phocaicum]BBZ54217.1 hypothetical protein MPHO_12090 [Mycolicibacterium phocaicum]
MGESFDYVPTQLTRAFRDAQSNEQFLGWLKMQEAVMEIEFPYYDLPEIREQMYTEASLAIVEQKLLGLYDNHRSAFSLENVHTTMRYVYYVGETFRAIVNTCGSGCFRRPPFRCVDRRLTVVSVG